MEAGVTDHLHSVGERCHLQKYNGTIRYVGEVLSAEGTWYGVEWDTERGKHDGMINGHRYFECSDKYGSFVRPGKLSFGIEGSVGLKKKYGNGKVATEEKPLVLHERTNRETVIEMVGFEKHAERQSNLESLREADLSGAHISHAGHPGLEQLSPNLKSLNLSDNLLSSLKEVYRIASSLQKLTVLNLSKNRISDWNSGDLHTSIAFQQLKCLYINKMQLKWHQLIDTLKMAPNVKDIHVCFNKIEDIWYDASLENLQVLNLEGNSISKWDSVQQLSKLTNLQKLILNSNKISKVEISADEADPPFKHLTSLSLSDNLIEEWNSINMITKLKALTEFRFRNNPICQDKTGFELRQELICRLGHVEFLNGSDVSARERKNAEIVYVKKYASDYHSARKEGSTTDFTSFHPTYLKLVSAHGLPEEEVDTKQSLKDNLLTLEIKCPECSTKASTQKKVPPTMTVQQLKGILQRLYKIPTSKQNISYLDVKNSREIHLVDNMKQLSYYSITSGDTVLLRW